MSEYITCSRCQTRIENKIINEHYTCGYYIVSDGYWNQFANSGEVYLCDACMFKDPRYIEIYGHHHDTYYRRSHA